MLMCTSLLLHRRGKELSLFEILDVSQERLTFVGLSDSLFTASFAKGNSGEVVKSSSLRWSPVGKSKGASDFAVLFRFESNVPPWVPATKVIWKDWMRVRRIAFVVKKRLSVLDWKGESFDEAFEVSLLWRTCFARSYLHREREN